MAEPRVQHTHELIQQIREQYPAIDSYTLDDLGPASKMHWSPSNLVGVAEACNFPELLRLYHTFCDDLGMAATRKGVPVDNALLDLVDQAKLSLSFALSQAVVEKCGCAAGSYYPGEKGAPYWMKHA